MKTSIIFLLISLATLNLLSSQNEVQLSNIEVEEKDKHFRFFLDGDEYNGFIYENHNNENIKIKFEVKDGFQNGIYEEYYENGKLKEKLNFKNGLLDGISELYKENGKLKEKHIYKKGERFK